jgi:hypothetical protein
MNNIVLLPLIILNVVLPTSTLAVTLPLNIKFDALPDPVAIDPVAIVISKVDPFPLVKRIVLLLTIDAVINKLPVNVFVCELNAYSDSIELVIVFATYPTIVEALIDDALIELDTYKEPDIIELF